MTNANQAEEPVFTPRAYTIDQFAKAFAISRSTVYREIEDGRLMTYKVGRRTLISAKVADEWQRVCELESAPPSVAASQLDRAQVQDLHAAKLKPTDYTPRELAVMVARK